MTQLQSFSPWIQTQKLWPAQDTAACLQTWPSQGAGHTLGPHGRGFCDISQSPQEAGRTGLLSLQNGKVTH